MLHFSYVANLFIVAVMFMCALHSFCLSPNEFILSSFNFCCNDAQFAQFFIFGKPKNMLEKSCILMSHQAFPMLIVLVIYNCSKSSDAISIVSLLLVITLILFLYVTY